MAKSNARICLAGEDLDWTNGTSILCGINLYTSVKIRPIFSSTNEIVIDSDLVDYTKNIVISKLQDYKYTGDFYDYVIAGINVFNKKYFQINPIYIQVSSSIPLKSGLSSSAALLVALFSELSIFYKLNINVDDICELCYITEAVELNCTVGKMDFYACCLGNIVSFDSSENTFFLEDFKLDNDISIVLIDSGISSSTKMVNMDKYKRFNDREQSFINYLKYGNELVSSLITELRTSKDINTIGKIITSYHHIIDKYLRVSTPKINKCVQICIKHGAIGAKLTGCGLGGYVFCIIKKENINLLAKTLKENNYEYIVCELNN